MFTARYVSFNNLSLKQAWVALPTLMRSSRFAAVNAIHHDGRLGATQLRAVMGMTKVVALMGLIMAMAMMAGAQTLATKDGLQLSFAADGSLREA
ncbi:MAG: hypothetical protein KEFWMYNX_002198, partial [Candidatus Fervidibacter sp.]